MLRNKHDNFYHSPSHFFMAVLRTKSVLRQNCSRFPLSLLKAADLLQNPLETHSALQAVSCFFCLPSSYHLPRRKIRALLSRDSLTRSYNLFKFYSFPLTSQLLTSNCIWCHQWGKLNTNWKAVANGKENNRTRKTTVPWAQGAHRGPQKSLKMPPLLSRQITSLLLTTWIFFWHLQCH